MTDEPDNIVLRYLRAIDAKLDRALGDIAELKTRAGRLESAVAQTHVHLAEHSNRMDRIDSRLDRIERRLELVSA